MFFFGGWRMNLAFSQHLTFLRGPYFSSSSSGEKDNISEKFGFQLQFFRHNLAFWKVNVLRNVFAEFDDRVVGFSGLEADNIWYWWLRWWCKTAVWLISTVMRVYISDKTLLVGSRSTSKSSTKGCCCC